MTTAYDLIEEAAHKANISTEDIEPALFINLTRVAQAAMDAAIERQQDTIIEHLRALMEVE